jgi:hypothetical protein
MPEGRRAYSEPVPRVIFSWPFRADKYCRWPLLPLLDLWFCRAQKAVYIFLMKSRRSTYVLLGVDMRDAP